MRTDTQTELIKKMICFWVLNIVIALVWYAIELLTLAELQQSATDSYICVGISLILTFVLRSKPVLSFLSPKETNTVKEK